MPAGDDAMLAGIDDSLLERFGTALDAERAALMSGDEEQLSRAEREKASLIDTLVTFDRTRAPIAGADALPRLRELADKNRLNGLLIAERLGEVQRRRQFFEHAAGRGSVYGRDGVTRPA